MRTTIASQLREAIKASGLTHPEIAELAGIGREKVWQFVNGTNCRIETAAKLAAALKLELVRK